MSDLALRWNVAGADLAVEDGDLALDDGLETAVIISLFTDRRADDGDELPGGPGTDRRGWWGDEDRDRIGSRLWLLSREKQQASVLERARAYALESLQWLLEDRVAAALAVTAEFTRPGWLGLQVRITRPTREVVTYQFDATWNAQAAPRAVALGARIALVVETEDGTVSLKVNQQLQNGAVTGAGDKVDTSGQCSHLTIYVIGSPGVTAGEVTPSEAHSNDYAGTPAPICPPIAVPSGGVIVKRVTGCYRTVLAPITVPVVGGTVDVFVMGN